MLLLVLAGCIRASGEAGGGGPHVATFSPQQITPLALAAPTLPPPTPGAASAGAYGAYAGGFPPGFNPFTGLPAPEAALERPPLLVKISNAPAIVRPQAGLGAADIVFEHYVEGGLTRFTALFQSDTPPRIGSVRSARLIDLELIPMFDAIFAYSGTSIGVGERFAVAPFYARTYSSVAYGSLFARDETIDAPHNLFIDPAAAWATARREGYDAPAAVPGFTFGDALPDGRAAATVTIRYLGTLVHWRYEAGIGRYSRSSDGIAHADANTGAPVYADNIVLLYAPHRETDIVESQFRDVIAYSLAIDLSQTGGARFVRDGQTWEGRWARQPDGALALLANNGTPFPLRPGTTWFQVLPPPEAWRGESVVLE
jgi:hypothetical protein